jgi:hypothetical protein
MKKISLLFTLVLGVASLKAQSSRTFAITSKTANDYQWNSIREIEISTGKIIKTIFESDKTPFQSFDALSKTAITDLSKSQSASGTTKPFAYGTAATAFDAQHNRLYFSPMHIAQIRYVDLSSGETNFFYLNSKLLDAPANGYLTEENQITRMVLIGKVGYAITNDGNHLFQFTTGKKPTVTDMGALVDDPKNGAISIHNKCTSWGGDVVADEDGLLYLISANKHVFKLDVASKIATHLGDLKGIPAQFTTNGAVVNNENKIVVTSANAAAGFYVFDLTTLDAKQLPNSVTTVGISDLANGNLLKSSIPKTVSSIETSTINKFLVKNDKINVFPNPITSPQFKLTFDEITNGNYTINVTDLMGRSIYSKRIVLQNEEQVETINVGKKPSNGLYFVKVTDSKNKDIYVGRLIVQ